MLERPVVSKLVASIVAIILAAALLGTVSFPGALASVPKKLTLVYNVNNAGYIDVCGCKHKEVRQGSLTRRASFLKQLRATGREICLLDGGSSLFTLEERVKDAERGEAIRKAELIVEGYNRMGYRATAVGSADLAAGLDTLRELEKKARYVFLSANLVDKETRKPYFKPHVVLQVGGVRLGVIGLTLNTMSWAYLAKLAPGAEVTDPFEAAKKSLEELRGKVDLVIALSHLREETNTELCAKLTEIGVVVDPCIQFGNHHTWLKEEEPWVSYRGDTLLLRSDGQGARLGVLDIEMLPPATKLVSAERLKELEEAVGAGTATAEEKTELADGRKKNAFTFTRVSLEPHHRTDPEMDLVIEEWKKNIDPSRVARLEADLPAKNDFLTVEKCKSCHEKQYENWTKTKHAHAMDSLLETGDQHRYDCVGCHSLGYGQAYLDTSKMGAFSEVQCESCHGTNPKHAEDPAAHKFSKIQRSDCIVCHNKEQLLTEFNYFPQKQKIQCPKG